MMTKPPLPPFNEETAIKKVRLAENAWNTKNPVTVSLAYTEDSFWRNRSEFIRGREEIVEFLKRKWNKDCLLYTSPSPRDTNPSRMPSSA